MTLQSSSSRIVYTGDGVQTEFPVPFRFLRPDDLAVYKEDGKFVLNSDYRVIAGDEDNFQNGGTVVFNTPYKGTIAILREVEFVQETDYVPNGDLPAETLEKNLDYLTMQTQELKEQMERAVTVPPTSLISPGEYLQVNIKIAEQAKDICLSSATAAANSAQTAATCERNISLIWGELSGDPTLAENALLTLKEAAEATGAVTAAAEIAKGEIVNTGAIALASVQKATEEAKEAAEVATNTAGSITGTVADQITIQVSQAVGADGVLGVAISEAEKVINDAKNELEQAQTNGMTELTDAQTAALAQIQGKVDAVSIDVQAAIERANVIAQDYLDNAKNTTDQAIEDLTNIRDNAIAAGDSALAEIAQKRLEAMQEISAGLSDAQSARDAALEAQEAAAGSSSSASGSASSAAGSAQEALKAYQDALAKAQEAAKSASDAEASRLAAESTATNVVNSSLVMHNASADAHPGTFVKCSGGGTITGNLILTGDGNGGLTANAISTKSIDAATIFASDGGVESRTTNGEEPRYRWYNGTAATDILMASDGTLYTKNFFAGGMTPFKAKNIYVESASFDDIPFRMVVSGTAWADIYLNSSSQVCIKTPDSQTVNGVLRVAELILEGVGNIAQTWKSVSKNANGYCKFPNGVIIQWGNVQFASSTASITFPLAFPTGCAGVYPVIMGADETGDVKPLVVDAVSTTGATFRVNSSTLKPFGIWFAVGF